MACVLFSRPNHDNTVSYLYHYSKELIKLSNDLGHKTINKEHIEVNKEIITKVIKKNNPNLIMLNGHGSSEVVCGHNNEIIISPQNSDLLNNSITYSFSCSSASILGPHAVKNGALCFIGYELDFALGKDPERQATPGKDKVAKLFLDPSNLLFSSLLKGNNVKEAMEKAKKQMNDNIWYLNTTDDFPEAQYYAPYLFANFIGLVAHGNIESSISS